MKARGCIFLVTAVGVAVVFGIIFWNIWGHELHLNVYADGEFWYREYLTRKAQIFFTVLISGLFGLLVASIIKLVQYYRKKFH
jgi:hypothetical protein